MAWVKQYTTRKAKILKVKYITLSPIVSSSFSAFKKDLLQWDAVHPLLGFKACMSIEEQKEQVVCFLRQEKKGKKVFAHMAMLSFTPIVSFPS